MGEPLTIEWPDELDLQSDLAIALGRPNFWCGQIAHAYQRGGFAIPPESEAEQAFIIHRIIRFQLSHGEGWRDAMEAELREVATRAIAANDQGDGQ
jgi:hypothetical protein